MDFAFKGRPLENSITFPFGVLESKVDSYGIEQRSYEVVKVAIRLEEGAEVFHGEVLGDKEEELVGKVEEEHHG